MFDCTDSSDINNNNASKSEKCVRKWSKELYSVGDWLQWHDSGGKVSVSSIFCALYLKHADRLNSIRMHRRVCGIALLCILIHVMNHHTSRRRVGGTNCYATHNQLLRTIAMHIFKKLFPAQNVGHNVHI